MGYRLPLLVLFNRALVVRAYKASHRYGVSYPCAQWRGAREAAQNWKATAFQAALHFDFNRQDEGPM